MQRRKPTIPSTTNGGYGVPAPSGYGSPYGIPAATAAPPGYGGGVAYGAATGTTGTTSSGSSTPNNSGGIPRYAGYGNSGSTSGGGGGGGGGGTAYSSSASSFGVGLGEAAGYDDDRVKGKKKRRGGGNSIVTTMLSLLKDKFVVAILMALLCFGSTVYYRSQYKVILKKFHAKSITEAVKTYERMEQERRNYQKDMVSTRDAERRQQTQIRELEMRNRELLKQKDEIRVQHESGHRMTKEESDKWKEREDAWRNQVYVLQNATQRESRRAVLERFGPGPHHVLFTVILPSESEHPDYRTFKVELAPLNDMPHANHLFLQQIYHELWDGTWFYLNGAHVLQAGPQDWEGDEEEMEHSLRRFSDAQLDTLSFPEYNPKFPHVMWTLGFTGRPGGPDWYINKADNSVPHGPGGQIHHSLQEQADSCFAKVVEGKETLEAIFKMEVYPRGSEYAHFLVEAVEIVSARILEPVTETIHKAQHPNHHTGGHAHKNKKPKREHIPNQEVMDELTEEQIANLVKSIEVEHGQMHAGTH